jgi:hypothetical protein
MRTLFSTQKYSSIAGFLFLTTDILLQWSSSFQARIQNGSDDPTRHTVCARREVTMILWLLI